MDVSDGVAPLRSRLRQIQATRPHARAVSAQVVDTVIAAVEEGELRGGQRLPSTRDLAALVGTTRRTAERIYDRLAQRGLVVRSARSGTFVRQLAPTFENRGAWHDSAIAGALSSPSRELLEQAYAGSDRPDFVPLANGWPADGLLPLAECRGLLDAVLTDVGPASLAFTPHLEGLPQLRSAVGRRGRAAGFARGPAEILVTSGASQAIDVVMRALVAPGEAVAIESPTTSAIVSAAAAARAQILGTPTDAEGIDVELIEFWTRKHEVKVLALQPYSHNPTGQDLSPSRREALLRLVRERNLVMLEDAVYANVRYVDGPTDPLRAEAPEHVVYVDSISKSLGGGWRVGWLAASGTLLDRLQVTKLDGDAATPTLSQYVAARALDDDLDTAHLRATAPEYRARRDALLAAIAEHFGGDARCAVPRGGHHVWVGMRGAAVDPAVFADEAFDRGVSFVPGAAVAVTPDAGTHIRLSFAAAEPERLRTGVARLSRAFHAARRRTLRDV